MLVRFSKSMLVVAIFAKSEWWSRDHDSSCVGFGLFSSLVKSEVYGPSLFRSVYGDSAIWLRMRYGLSGGWHGYAGQCECGRRAYVAAGPEMNTAVADNSPAMTNSLGSSFSCLELSGSLAEKNLVGAAWCNHRFRAHGAKPYQPRGFFRVASSNPTRSAPISIMWWRTVSVPIDSGSFNRVPISSGSRYKLQTLCIL